MKKVIALLLSILMMSCTWGALAEQSMDVDSLMLLWKDSYLTESDELKRLTQEDALRIAADMLLTMDYVSTDTLSMYQPSFTLDNDKNWIVSFEPSDLFTDLDPYHVEVNAGNGVIISMVIGANRYLPSIPMEPHTKTLVEIMRNEPVNTESLDDFIKQMTIKQQQYGGWMLPDPVAGTPYLKPGASDMPQGEAYRLAIQSLQSAKNLMLEEFTELNTFFALATDDAGRHVWTIRFYPQDLINWAKYIELDPQSSVTGNQYNVIAEKEYYVVTIDADKAELINVEAITPSMLPRGIVDETAYDELIQYWCAIRQGFWDLPKDDGFNDSPKGNEIAKEPALRMAVETILKQQNWPLDLLYAFAPNMNFYQIKNGMDNIAPNQRAWAFYFGISFEKSLPGLIRIVIDAPTQTITDYSVYHNQYTSEPTASNIGAVAQNEAIGRLVNAWKETMGDDFFTPTTKPFDDSQPQLGMSYVTLTTPQSFDIQLDTALRLSVDAIMQFYGVEADMLASYKPAFRFCVPNADTRYWSILFEGSASNSSLSTKYLLEVKSPSGFIQRIHME